MTVTTAPQLSSELTASRLNLMRAGYLFMGLGLALVKWPHLSEAHRMPAYEGVTLCMLTAMSVLAFLGLRHPVRLVPVLVLESAWKLLWLSVVALPQAAGGSLGPDTRDIAVNCSLVVVILAVTPWTHVWRRYVVAAGERWR